MTWGARYTHRESCIRFACRSLIQYPAEMHHASHVPPQLDMYSKKFDEIQGTVSKSNSVYSSFKQDMDKVRLFSCRTFEVVVMILVMLSGWCLNKSRSDEVKNPMRFCCLLFFVYFLLRPIFGRGFGMCPFKFLDLFIYFLHHADGKENEEAGEGVPVVEESLWWLQQESHWHGGRCKNQAFFFYKKTKARCFTFWWPHSSGFVFTQSRKQSRRRSLSL